MYIKNDIISVVFRVIFIIVCGAGMVIKLFTSGLSLSIVLSDFALVVNAFALIYFAYLIIVRPGYERGVFRGAVTIYMVITFIAYYFDDFGAPNGLIDGLSAANYLLYFVTPLMALADYLLFCRKGEFSAYSPLLWAILPILFNLAVYLANRFGLEMDAIPYLSLPNMNLIATLLLFLGVSYLLFVLDNLMVGRRR